MGKESRLLLAPKISYNFLPNKPTYTHRNGRYEFSADRQQQYSIVYPDGSYQNVGPVPIRLGADVGFKRVNLGTHRAWSLLVGTDWGMEFYPSKGTYSGTYKGQTVSGWHPQFTYWQLNGALTCYWLNPTKLERGIFLRLGAGQTYSARHLKYSSLSFANSYPANYIDNGNGDLTTLKDYQEHNICLIPELGLVDGWLEVSLSTNLPLQSSFTEVHTIYEKNRVVSQDEINYRLGSIYLNIRGVVNVVRKASKSPRPQSDPNPVPRVTIPPPGPRVELSRVYFKVSTAELLATSYPELNELVIKMQQQPALRIRLEGHTDIIGGTAAQHQLLSEERVAAIKRYLVEQGIAAERIEVIGYGDTRPKSRNCPPPNGCPQNRRVEFEVLAF